MSGKALFLVTIFFLLPAFATLSKAMTNPFLEGENQNYGNIEVGQSKIIIDGRETCRAGFFEKDGVCVFGYDSIINKRLADMYPMKTRSISEYSYVGVKGAQPKDSSFYRTVNVFLYPLGRDGGATQLTYRGNAQWPVFSPRGRHVAYSLEEYEKVVKSDRYNVTRKIGITDIKSRETQNLDIGEDLINPGVSWSPDERYLAYTSLADNFDGSSSLIKNCIKAINIETTDVFYIYCSRHTKSSPQWSPSGAHILFKMTDMVEVSNLDGGSYITEDNSTSTYYTVDINGKTLNMLTKPKNKIMFGPANWSADGEHVIILLINTENGKTVGRSYIKVRYDGSSETEVANKDKEIIVDQEYFPYYVHPY